jgi:hypothetical protein
MKIVSLITFSVLAATNLMAANFETKLNTNAAVPEFSLRWMNHPTDTQTLWKSADFNDAVYVIEAYFDNCPYCHDNAPLINDLSGDFATDSPQVKFLDVSRDCSESEYRQWIASEQPNHPVLNDCDQAVLGPLHIGGYPTTVILDCKLNPVFRHEGSMNSSELRELREAIDAQVAANCNRG